MRWKAHGGDGSRVGDILDKAGVDRRAVTEGRVFIGRKRVRSDDESVNEGDVVEIARAVEAHGKIAILVQADDFVAVSKPAGIPTIADHAGASHALVALVARDLGVRPDSLHPTSRLDRDVSGVVVLARTQAAAQRLLQARAAGKYERRYAALAIRAPVPAAGTWEAPIGRARDPRLREPYGRDAIPALTAFATCACIRGGAAMLAVSPRTGRTHQIRVHSAHAGSPLLGDSAYGGPIRVTMPSGRVLAPGRVALHAVRVVVPDAAGRPVAVEAPIPVELLALWSELGGEPSAWERCAACVFDPPSSSSPPSAHSRSLP
ncbi:MAG: RluA family pseudouridine synthase [Polyangiaceae bacterium]|jgi:23S rRNA-/tRNA-specific pseudouridylate synthase